MDAKMQAKDEQNSELSVKIERLEKLAQSR